MYVKRLVFVYVCEGFSYLCAFVKIDCVFVFGLMYSCMLNAFRPTASGSKLLGQIFGYFFRPRLCFSYGRMCLCMLKGSHSCTFVDDFRICVRLRNWPYLCTSVSRFHLGPRLVRISVSMLCFCLCKYVFHGCTQTASKYISKKTRGAV